MSVEGQPTLIKFLLWLVCNPAELEKFRRDRKAYRPPADAPPIPQEKRNVLNDNKCHEILDVIDKELGYEASAGVGADSTDAPARARPQPAVLVIT